MHKNLIRIILRSLITYYDLAQQLVHALCVQFTLYSTMLSLHPLPAAVSVPNVVVSEGQVAPGGQVAANHVPGGREVLSETVAEENEPPGEGEKNKGNRNVK